MLNIQDSVDPYFNVIANTSGRYFLNIEFSNTVQILWDTQYLVLFDFVITLATEILHFFEICLLFEVLLVSINSISMLGAHKEFLKDLRFLS